MPPPLLPLNPAPKVSRGKIAFMATEAGRSSRGLVATVFPVNGTPKKQHLVYFGEPESCTAFADSAAPLVKMTAAAVEKVLPELAAIVEARLRERDAGDARDAGRQSLSQASQLVQLAAEAELFHTPDGEGFATIMVAEHRETWPLKAKAFRRWLARRYYETTTGDGKPGVAPNAAAIQDAIGVLEGRALFDGAEHAVWTRVAEQDGRIYLDLANSAWEAIEIDPDGWRVVDEHPIKFRRARGMAPLPYPVTGGSIAKLREYLNVGSDEDFLLVVAWLVGSLRPRGPYVVLLLYGEQGTGKSSLVRVLRMLVDPSTVPLRSEPREVRDLVIAATNSWCITLDNLSDLRDWLSDALCRLATGGGFGTRELYTDQDEVLFESQRPIILNGIEEVATRADLIDRGIAVTLPPIPDDKRQDEETFWASFEAERPQFLGVLLDAVSRALRDVSTIKAAYPRMADFARWVSAAAPALGWTRDEFLAAYVGNRRTANDSALEAAAIVPALRDLLDTHPEDAWRGSATELLRLLASLTAEREVAPVKDGEDEQHRSDAVRKKVENILTWRKEWPRNGRALSGTLRRLAPSLRAAGIGVDFDRSGSKRAVVLRKSGIFASSASSASQPTADKVKTSDAKPEDVTQNAEPVTQTSGLASHAEPLPGMGNDAADANDANVPSSPSRSTADGGGFVPSADWQEIPNGFPCPPGGLFNMNFTTGKNMGRWPTLAPAAPADDVEIFE